MKIVSLYNIVKNNNIIDYMECDKFELIGEDVDSRYFDTEWNSHSNQQDMKIYLGNNTYICISKKHGIKKMEYKFNKNFISYLKEYVEISEKMLKYSGNIEYIKILSIIKSVISEIDNEVDPAIFIGIIKMLEKWASETYESKNICFGVGIDFDLATDSYLSLDSVMEEEMCKVLTNGIDTIIQCDKNACVHDVINIKNIDLKADGVRKFVRKGTWTPSYKRNGGYYPEIFKNVACWTDRKKIAFVLNHQGEILIFYNKSLSFAKRRGEWIFFSPGALLHLMLTPQTFDSDVKQAVIDTCLDVSFSRTGACIGIIPKGEKIPGCIKDESLLKNNLEIRNRFLNKIIQDRKFHEIDRHIRKELAAIDGAIVIDGSGVIYTVGAILDNRKCESRSGTGARSIAAQTLAISGCGIKVSADGKITAWNKKYQPKNHIYNSSEFMELSCDNSDIYTDNYCKIFNLA